MSKLIKRQTYSCLKSIYLSQHLPRRVYSKNKNNNLVNNSQNRYKIFKDEDAPIILDVVEESVIDHKKSEVNKVSVRNNNIGEEIYTRGLTGVFEIHELISILKEDNAKSIFVANVPTYLRYVDYFVVVSGTSRRHILGLAEYVLKIYKKKKHSHDIIPKIEGKDSDWIAIDLGNVALHIMSDQKREKYDLESLWTVGSEFDSKANHVEDEILRLINKHSINLDDLKPLDQ